MAKNLIAKGGFGINKWRLFRVGKELHVVRVILNGGYYQWYLSQVIEEEVTSPGSAVKE